MRPIKVYELTAEMMEQRVSPFPEEIHDDPWIAYHGTSNLAEARIEESGFAYDGSLISKSDVADVVELFNKMCWAGKHQGGFSVLRTYATSDFLRAGDEAKSVFFGESFFRGLLYANSDWAGGETARALRHAFNDLDSYLDSPAVRDQAVDMAWKWLAGGMARYLPSDCVPASGEMAKAAHLRAFWKFHLDEFDRPPSFHGCTVTDPPPPTLSEIDAEMDRLDGLFHRVRNMAKEFRHGVVYAVRFTRGEAARLSHSNGGLALRGPLPPDRIIAKAIIPKEVFHADDGLHLSARDWIDRLDQDGVLRAARSSSGMP